MGRFIRFLEFAYIPGLWLAIALAWAANYELSGRSSSLTHAVCAVALAASNAIMRFKVTREVRKTA